MEQYRWEKEGSAAQQKEHVSLGCLLFFSTLIIKPLDKKCPRSSLNGGSYKTNQAGGVCPRIITKLQDRWY